MKPEPNRPPAFGEHTATFNISVNVREGVRVAPPFTAEDPNGDTLAYSIVSGTPGAFTINAATGEVLMGGLELEEGSTHTATITVTDGVNARWQEDMAADDSLDLTMTIVNPNIVIEPSSHAAFPRGLWVDDDIVVTTNESSRDHAMFYDRETQQYLEDRSFRVGGNSYPTIRGTWSDGTTLYVLAAQRSWSNPRGKIFAYQLSDGSKQRSKDIILPGENAHPIGPDRAGRRPLRWRRPRPQGLRLRHGDPEPTERRRHQRHRHLQKGHDRPLDGRRDHLDQLLAERLRQGLRRRDRSPQAPAWTSNSPGKTRGPSASTPTASTCGALDQVNDTIYGYVVPR